MYLSRRDMLKLSAGAGAALAVGPVPLFAQGRAIIEKPIPSSGERIPVIGLGTARTFNVGASDEERAPLREVLRLFHEMGGRLLDTASRYGQAEQVSGDLARDLGIGDELFLATKVNAEGKEAGIEQLETSMRRLGRRTIDLMQVHNIRGWQTQLATLRAWKEQGRFRYIGITTSSRRQYSNFAAVMESEQLDFVQLNYSIGNREAEQRLLPLARDRGMAVIINEPFRRGRLFQAVEGRSLPDWATDYDIESWAQYFLKFIVSHPAVTCAIPATSKPHHLEDNMRAVYGRLPDDAGRAGMAEYFDAL